MEQGTVAPKPIRRGIFLVHGELPAIAGLKVRISTSLPELVVMQPSLDATYELGGGGSDCFVRGDDTPVICVASRPGGLA